MACLLLLALLILPASAAPGLFAVKPDWWDATVPRSPPVARFTSPAVAWELLSATNNPWLKPLDGWRVVGPFDGARGQGMVAVLPPEKAIGNSPMPGKGAPVSWKEWKAGQPCPIPAEMTDAIVYGFRLLRIDVPTRTWLVAEGTGRIRAWLDGRPVMDGGASETAGAELDLPPGLHQLLVKLDAPAGKWSFRAALTPFPPEQAEIRCRTVIVQRWPDDAAAVELHGIELARLYARLDDAPNFRFWVARVLAVQKDPARVAAVAASWDAVVSRRPDMAVALQAALRQQFMAARDNPPIRDVLGARMLKSLSVDDMDSGVRAFQAAGYNPPTPQAAQFLNLCVASNRLATLPYWMGQCVRRETSPAQAVAVFQPLMAKAGDVARQALYDGIERVLQSQPLESSAPLIRFYAETAQARSDMARLDRLLDLNDGMARRVLPFEAALWDLDVARSELDQDRARAALAAAALAKPAYTNDPGYNQARAEVFKMRAGTARPGAILNDSDDAVQTTARFTRQNETSRLHGYIRRMLVERGHFLVADAADNNLFSSAKALYRSLFAGYAATYNPFLAREVADLAARPGMAAEAVRLQRCASLASPAAPLAAPAAAQRTLAQVSEPQGVFGGQFDLPAGMEEACGEETRTTQLGAWQPVLSGSGTDLDGLLVVQNSRSVAAFAGGVLRWSYVAAPVAGQYNRSHVGYGGLCRPARAGSVVAVRLETGFNRFELIGFDARSGVIRWRWHGTTDTEEPVGSPAVWRGTHFLVPALRYGGTEESELAMVALDAATGQESIRLPLCGTTRLTLVSAACANAALSQHRMLPAPTVVGDSVYVDTGLGMICALDLKDECVRWARLYQRKFDDAGGGMRLQVPPIAGSRNVLFAPADSRWLLLVDRHTGALVHRRTDLSWTSIGRCGPEHVLVTTATSMQRLSLAGPESGQVMDRARMLCVAPLADGCVLAAPGELVVMDSQARLVRTLPVPRDVVPVCMDTDGRWWGWGGTGGCTWGRLDDTTARRPLRLPAVAAGAGPLVLPQNNYVYEASWLPFTEGACRMYQSLLARVNADGRLRWEMPLPPGASVLECGTRMAASFRRRVWTFDDADGSVCSVWPPLIGATNEVDAVRAGTRGTSLYASTAAPAAGAHARIWDLGVEGREQAVPLAEVPFWPGQDFWVTTVATQLFVVVRAQNDSDVRLFRALRPETPRTAPPVDAALEAQWNGQFSATVWFDRMRRNAVIFGRDPAETVRFSYKGMTRRPVQGLSELWNGAAAGWGDLMVFRYTRDAFVRVTEPMEGGSVVLRERADDNKMERPPWRFSGQIGAEVFGMHALATNQLMVYRQDLARVSETGDASQAAVLTGPAPGPGDAWRGVVSLGDGRIMMLATCKAERNELMRGYIWTPGSAAVKAVLLPAATQPLQPLATNLWSYGESFLTSADWARCAALESQVQRVTWTNGGAGAGSFVADGFLDEWTDGEFIPVPQGRLAVRRPARGSVFHVALEITNAAAVAAMAASPDLLSACRVWAGCGDAANFDALRTRVLPLSNSYAMGDGRPVRCCAWQVTPDSRRATMELELSAVAIPVRKPDEAIPERAQRFGDLALRITLDDPLAGSVDLAGNLRAGALGFVRLLLP
ncbi:MAG: PQQ-binding-like beta-propeller repeat protein [bacterium]